jgi:uncharacterized protein
MGWRATMGGNIRRFFCCLRRATADLVEYSKLSGKRVIRFVMHWYTKKILGFLGRHWPVTALCTFAFVLIMTPHTLERLFIYYPTKTIVENPSTIGLAYENLNLITEDRVKLHGWYIPAPGAYKTIMIFHGNAGNIGHRVQWIEELHSLDAHILIIDYRGYGNSEGNPFEEGLYRDARAAYEWWQAHRTGAGDKLILLGESLGGSVAIDLASRIAPAGLIVQSTFTSAADMARLFFPLGLLRPLLGIHFDSTSKIRGVTCPKLFIHGNRDEIVPFRMGRELYEMASPPKSFYEVAGAGHNDLVWVGGSEYISRLRSFLAQF